MPGTKALAYLASSPVTKTKVFTTVTSAEKRVRVNQRNCFPPNVCRFLLPARPQWVEPAGGEERKSGRERKSADVEQKTVTLIYPYPRKDKQKLSQNFISNSVQALLQCPFQSSSLAFNFSSSAKIDSRLSPTDSSTRSKTGSRTCSETGSSSKSFSSKVNL